MPMHGRVEVAAVLDLDLNLRAFRYAHRRTRNRSVVAKHPHDVLADLLRNRLDAQCEQLPVGQLNHFGRPRRGHPGRVGWEGFGRGSLGVDTLMHCQSPFRTAIASGACVVVDAASCADPARTAILSAMYAASSLTKPSSAEPRVYCHCSPSV